MLVSKLNDDDDDGDDDDDDDDDDDAYNPMKHKNMHQREITYI